MRGLFVLLLSFTASAVLAQGTPAASQTAESLDSRWVSWIGCWRPSDQRAPEEGPHVCVVPAGPAGATMITLAGDQTVVEETVVPDGTDRSVNEPECRGSRQASWSRDGERLF